MNAIRLGLCLALACGAGPGLFAQNNEVSIDLNTSRAANEPERSKPGAAPPRLSIEERLQKLTLRERVAQLMVVTLEGAPQPNMGDVELMRSYTPGGVIVPELLRPGTAASYVARLRGLPIEATRGIPLFIGANLYELPRRGNEKFPQLFVPMPSLLAVGAAADPEVTERLSKLVADHMRAMGFNLHVGPSLELAPNLPGAKGSNQCLGADPRFVAESGATIISTLAKNGVLAMPMNFPGGAGNRRENGPPVLLTAAPGLAERDALPYRRAIEGGADILHVGNILVPTIDPSNEPASLSSKVMRDLLRTQLGFKGVIVVGPMDSSEIAMRHDPTEAALLALKAGADMIYWNQAGQRVKKTVDTIVSKMVTNELSQDAVDNALRRVMEVKDRHNLIARPLPKPAEAEKLGKKRVYPKEALEVERRSVTLVQNRDNLLPLRKASLPVSVTGVVGVESLANALEEYYKFVPRQRIASARHGNDIFDFEIDRITSHLLGIQTMIVVVTPEVRLSSQLKLISALQTKGIRVIAVLLGYPETLPQLSGADAIVLAYCDPAAPNVALLAVAEVLAGRGPLGTRPLVSDVKAKAGEVKRFNALDLVRAPAGQLPVDIEAPYLAGLAVPYDPTETIKKVHWDFGDGKKSKGLVVERAYAAAGRYPITLTVTDKRGQVTKRTFYALVE